MLRKTLLILILIFNVGFAYSSSIGAVPGSVEFSNVEPGEEDQLEIYVTTNVEEVFTVNPSARADFSSSSITGASQPESFSEQGSGDWFNVESATIDPNTSERVTLPDGSPANVDGGFELNLEVPEDAQPGIHMGHIRLNSDLEGDGSGAGSTVFGETRIRYLVNVEGHADRSIEVQDVRSFRLGEEEASVEVLLTNTGSVTASTESFEVDVYDSSRNEMVELTVGSARIAPGDSEWVATTWADEDRIEGGSYELDGEVSYLTGSSYASGSFSLPDFDVVEVVPDDSPQTDEDERETVPMWLVFMVLAVLAVLMWSFNIEPFWILAIVGGLAVTSFILLSGVSNYLAGSIINGDGNIILWCDVKNAERYCGQ